MAPSRPSNLLPVEWTSQSMPSPYLSYLKSSKMIRRSHRCLPTPCPSPQTLHHFKCASSPDAQKREGKTATTVVVTLSPDHARSLGSTVRLFSRARHVQILRTATATTHCTKCFGLGHHQTVCKQKHDTCPLCAKDHTHKAHKCFRKNKECPRGGHLRAVTGCCDVTPLLCINCKGAHAAFDPICPKKLAAEEAVMKKLKEKAEAGVHRTHRRAGSNVEMHG